MLIAIHYIVSPRRYIFTNLTRICKNLHPPINFIASTTMLMFESIISQALFYILLLPYLDSLTLVTYILNFILFLARFHVQTFIIMLSFLIYFYPKCYFCLGRIDLYSSYYFYLWWFLMFCRWHEIIAFIIDNHLYVM